MKKTLTISLLFASMILAACNTSETSSSNDPANEANSKEEVIDTNNSTNIEENTDEQVESSTPKQPEQKTEADSNTYEQVTNEQTINFTFNNEEFQAKTNAVTSEQLGYKMQLADGFTLTSEEPGSDILFYTADSSYSMRVEYYSIADNSYDALLTTVENLMVVSTNNNFEKLTIEQSAFNIHKGAQFISVDEASGLQTIGAIFEKGDKIIVLTIFDGPENSLKDAFLQMAYSIE